MADYIPQNPAEQYFYDALWKYANPAGEGELSGKAAVTFFQMSGVDIGILKQIWSLSTPTASMNREQFNSAIRYITMMQQGEIPLSKGKQFRDGLQICFICSSERLRSSSKVNLGLPKFNGIDIPRKFLTYLDCVLICCCQPTRLLSPLLLLIRSCMRSPPRITLSTMNCS